MRNKRSSFVRGSAVLCALVGAIALTGCGKQVEVPTAHVGKVKTSQGFQDELKQPSTFRLPVNPMAPAHLVLTAVSDNMVEEPMTVFMPEDQLKLAFDVRGTFSISGAEERVNIIFDRLEAASTNDARIHQISFEKVYETYAQQIVRTTARHVITHYTIEHVLSNLDAVSQEIHAAVQAKLAETPIDATVLALANVDPPQVIIDAQEAAKKREIEIKEAEADKLVKLTEADAALEVARKQQEVDLVEAETQVLVNQKLAEGVTPAFVTQRMIKVMETLAASPNKVFIIDDEALKNPAMLMGITNNAFQPEPAATQQQEGK
ncbi:MAG: SPFH domain-containing protein [Bdellovibrionales bacterium]|nr:SPFH domain-containing protein [Bdellovibrionales bacterium]